MATPTRGYVMSHNGSFAATQNRKTHLSTDRRKQFVDHLYAVSRIHVVEADNDGNARVAEQISFEADDTVNTMEWTAPKAPAGEGDKSEKFPILHYLMDIAEHIGCSGCVQNQHHEKAEVVAAAPINKIKLPYHCGASFDDGTRGESTVNTYERPTYRFTSEDEYDRAYRSVYAGSPFDDETRESTTYQSSSAGTSDSEYLHYEYSYPAKNQATAVKFDDNTTISS